MTKVAFVIVCWNNCDLLNECFESVRSQSYQNISIIMVDNGSQDGSVTYVHQHFPAVRVIETGSNLGFAKGNNVGIREALTDPAVGFVALINTDARLERDWLEKIIEFAQQKPKGAAFQGTTLDYFDHSLIDSTHIFIARNGQATQSHYQKRYRYELGPKKVFGVNAAAAVFSRAFIEAEPFDDFFDETMFMYLEDVDVATRATVMGWDNYLVPGARAYHMGSKSSGKNPGFSLYMTFRNNLSVLVKNLPVPLLIKMAPRMMRADWQMFRWFRRQGMKKESWKMVQGRLAGLIYLPIVLLKRRRLSRLTTIDPCYLWSLMEKGY